MRVVKQRKYRKARSPRYFKKFLYFNYFFNILKFKNRDFFTFSKLFSGFKTSTASIYDKVVISVFENER